MYDLFGNSVSTQSKCKVNIRDNALEVITPYNPQFIALIKSLPQIARRFDPASKAWQVDTQYAEKVKEWIKNVFGEEIEVPLSPNNTRQEIEVNVLDVWYIGRTKPSGDEYVANAMNANKEWAFIFPEHVLREWFEGTGDHVGGPTLYGVLGIHRDATQDEIRHAYRRLARHWHPDICKEPDAHEMFIKIKNAYEILSDLRSRAKYDAGLELEATLKLDKLSFYGGYRSPLLCGYVLAEGYKRLGKIYVTRILDWREIVTNKGILVASWQPGNTEPTWTFV